MRNHSFFQLLFRSTYFEPEKRSQREKENWNEVEGDENCEHVSPHIHYLHSFIVII